MQVFPCSGREDCNVNTSKILREGAVPGTVWPFSVPNPIFLCQKYGKKEKFRSGWMESESLKNLICAECTKKRMSFCWK